MKYDLNGTAFLVEGGKHLQTILHLSGFPFNIEI